MQVSSITLLTIARHCGNLAKVPAILGLTARDSIALNATMKRNAPNAVEVALVHSSNGNAMVHCEAPDGSELDLPVHQLADCAAELLALLMGIRATTSHKPVAPLPIPPAVVAPAPVKVWTSADALRPASAPPVPDSSPAGTSRAVPVIIATLRARKDVMVSPDAGEIVFQGIQGQGVGPSLKEAGYRWDAKAHKAQGVNRWFLHAV